MIAKKHILYAVILLFVPVFLKAQPGPGYWQQRVEYTMNIKMNTDTHQLSGTQHLVYYNNSPDTLKKVYYHLYFNAFQPGSMMDVRSRTISDPDRRVGDRISKLKDNEIGFQHIAWIKQDNVPVTFKIEGTVMEVKLNKPLLPKAKAVFDLQFNAQVPIQIRRSGRDNSEGIAYSMTQWYPKIAEYDFQGWHAYQYVAREFHGVWGDFNVSITIKPSFTIAATGILQNPDKIGHGYGQGKTVADATSSELTWNFIAKDVIDFAWAADPDYTHTQVQVPNGPVIHLFYQKSEKTEATWKKMEDTSVKVFQYLNEHFGRYPFNSYSIIQGGDGGMEYPMCTLILGEGKADGVIGTMAHEVAHSWYQMALASNESLHPWMDEGYTSFASAEAMASIMGMPNPHTGAYQSYFYLAKSNLQEPANQHSDHFNTNRAYTTVAYSMGEVFLEQMKYLIGEENFYRGMKAYYNTWKMKHPSPNDFIRVMEKVSDMQLGWYLRYWIGTTKKIDYGFGVVTDKDGSTYVEVKRVGEFPMPIDLMVTYKDGSQQLYYLPMNELMGVKPATLGANRIVSDTWPWVNPSYVVKINRKLSDIESLEIDPSQRMADINRTNNKIVLSEIVPFQNTTK
ncbi:MAG: M1 family metallopeptidase [Bacteroidetes bacterium]|nr:M1 family metallopeptidase [Bacteroidota bacterium]MBS1541945.1 M1 family metallopeptidase [Bacteroidota bacterium]